MRCRDLLRVQVRRQLFTPQEARDALAVLRGQVEPTPTVDLGLRDIAPGIGLVINHSPYDKLNVTFALASGSQQGRRGRRPVRDRDALAS